MVYFVSAPQLAWNALFKHIDRPIPLITDTEMYCIIQPNIRRNICNASVCYVRANNNLKGSLYDPRQQTSYNREVKAKHLLDLAMSEDMTDSNFVLLSKEKTAICYNF